MLNVKMSIFLKQIWITQMCILDDNLLILASLCKPKINSALL